MLWWQAKQKSIIGFMIMTDGTNVHHRQQKVEYATVMIMSSSWAAVVYTLHTPSLDTLEGINSGQICCIKVFDQVTAVMLFCITDQKSYYVLGGMKGKGILRRILVLPWVCVPIPFLWRLCFKFFGQVCPMPWRKQKMFLHNGWVNLQKVLSWDFGLCRSRLKIHAHYQLTQDNHSTCELCAGCSHRCHIVLTEVEGAELGIVSFTTTTLSHKVGDSYFFYCIWELKFNCQCLP